MENCPKSIRLSSALTNLCLIRTIFSNNLFHMKRYVLLNNIYFVSIFSGYDKIAALMTGQSIDPQHDQKKNALKNLFGNISHGCMAGPLTALLYIDGAYQTATWKK